MPENENVATQDSYGNLSIDDAVSRAVDESTEKTEPDDNSSDNSVEARADSTTEADTATKTAPENNDTVDWDKLPPAAKKAYEAERQKYENYRSLNDRQTREWKKSEETYKSAQAKAQQFDQLDNLYKTNPELKQAFDKVFGVHKNVDPTLEADPLYKYIRDFEARIDSRLNPLLENHQSTIKSRQEKAIDDQMDSITKSASDAYKSYFGKEPAMADMSKLYGFMADKKIYDGSAAVHSLYMKEIMDAKVQSILSEQSAKKNKSTKGSNLNSSRSVPNGQVKSYEDAIEQAMQELNINF